MNDLAYNPELDGANPFTDDFTREEIKWMELDTVNPDIHIDGLSLIHRPLNMRMDDYLNKNWRLGDLTAPMFYIDGKIWMSLTPMEIQSNYLAWTTASGRVGMGGLGMGYAPLRAAAEEDVEEVVVFESDRRVIDLFTGMYKHREEFEKIQFVHGDARETFKGYEFDMVFMDIYQTMLPEEVLTDRDLFNQQNIIEEYHFWGEEKIILAGILEELITPYDLTYPQARYFDMWNRTEESNMYNPLHDDEFVIKALTKMGLY